jgi:uncharacterized membrane protein YcaP (DUF421 family)
MRFPYKDMKINQKDQSQINTILKDQLKRKKIRDQNEKKSWGLKQTTNSDKKKVNLKGLN